MKSNRLIRNVEFSLLTVLIFSCNTKRNVDFYLPAEWEHQEAVIVGSLDDNATFEMLIQLAKESKVYCLMVDSNRKQFEAKLIASGVNIDSVHFLSSPKEFSYAERDGLLHMKNGEGQKQLIEFSWNCYGWYFENEYKDYLDSDKKNRALYNSLYQQAFAYPVVQSNMVNEGGAIETNGKGVILQVESVNMQRNPAMSKADQESELKRVLNAKKIIWLKEGAAEDPFGWGALIAKNYFGVGVKGHLDEFCRFVDENTILISFPDSLETLDDPVQKLSWDRMKINYEILKNSTDQDGKPFNIIKMPVPDADYMTFALDTANANDEINFLSHRILNEQKQFVIGDTVHFVPSSSYLNFLITNKTVFEAKYWKEGKSEACKAKDEKAKEILQKYFPDRRIYQINTSETNHNGGGLHCWTMQVPK